MCVDKVLEKSKILSILDKNNFFKVPENVSRLRIDIGTSIDAPNSAIWLTNSDDVFVIGVEPNPDNIQQLIKRTSPYPNRFMVLSLWDDQIILDGHNIKNIGDRFLFLNCAIDNVGEPCFKKFYMTDDVNTGCSSLFEPTEKLNIKIKNIIEVPTLSMQYLLAFVPWHNFESIEILKIDAQGKDFDILKSMGEFLSKIVFLHIETTTFGCYHGACEPIQIRNFLNQNGFKYLFGHVNETYFNMRFFGNYTEDDFRNIKYEFLDE